MRKISLAQETLEYENLSNSKLRIILAATGAVVLCPVGGHFLALVIREPGQAFDAACKYWSEGIVPVRLAAEAAKLPPCPSSTP
jgi:hypothetical protein